MFSNADHHANVAWRHFRYYREMITTMRISEADITFFFNKREPHYPGSHNPYKKDSETFMATNDQ